MDAFVFTHLLEEGMNVVDAGANVGQYTLLASPIVGLRGSVHSFEPVPATFSRLRQNVDLNRLTNVSLNRAALWNKIEELQLALSSEQLGNVGAYTAHSLYRNPQT